MQKDNLRADGDLQSFLSGNDLLDYIIQPFMWRLWEITDFFIYFTNTIFFIEINIIQPDVCKSKSFI